MTMIKRDLAGLPRIRCRSCQTTTGTHRPGCPKAKGKSPSDLVGKLPKTKPSYAWLERCIQVACPDMPPTEVTQLAHHILGNWLMVEQLQPVP